MAKCIDCGADCGEAGKDRQEWCDYWEAKAVEKVKSCLNCNRNLDCNENKDYCNHNGFVYWEEIKKSCKTCWYFGRDAECYCIDYSRWKPKETPSEPIETTEQGTTEAAKHYQVSDMQPIEIMQSYLPKEQFVGFLRGNVIKYILRMGHKDDTTKEAEKACQYAEWLVKALRDEKIRPGGKK